MVQKTGLVKGRLRPCPESPNCVSSCCEASDDVHYFAPLVVAENPIPRIKSALDVLGLRLVAFDDCYLYCVAVTKVLRFKDDIEFHYVGDENQLYFRSASRVGYSDLGANRRRLEKLIDTLQL